MKKHHGKGKISHGSSHLETHGGGKDKMAHESHHKANAKHDMHDGMSPPTTGYEGHEGAGGGAPNEKCD